MTDKVVKDRQNMYKRAYRERKKKGEMLIVKGAEHVFDKGIEIVKSMIKSSNSNPVMGMVSAVILADILARAKIIDNRTAAGIWVIVGAIEGSTIAGTLISDFTDIFKMFSKSPSQDLLRPSATTIVYSDAQDKAVDLQALMNKE